MTIDTDGARVALKAIDDARRADETGRDARTDWIIAAYAQGATVAAIHRALAATAREMGLDPTDRTLGISESAIHAALRERGAKAARRALRASLAS